MLYIEQPVGTGYSQGIPNIRNEDDLAAQFVGFLQQFLEVFPELKGKQTYLSGESVRLEPFFTRLWVLSTIRIWVSHSMLGCTSHVSSRSFVLCVFKLCADLSQTSPIIFTKRRHLLICRCKESGLPTVSDHSTPSTLPHISALFLLAVLGWDVVQGQVPAVDFVHKYEHVFSFKCVLTPLRP